MAVNLQGLAIRKGFCASLNMTADSGMKRIFPVGYDNGFGDETDIPGQI